MTYTSLPSPSSVFFSLQVSEGSLALALGQGSGLFPQVPSQGLWCPVARLALLQPIKLLPRPVLLVSAVSAALVVLVA